VESFEIVTLVIFATVKLLPNKVIKSVLNVTFLIPEVEKTFPPNAVTESGIIICCKDGQFWNALVSRNCRFVDSVTLDNEVHPEKALEPIYVTDGGIKIVGNEEQP
jgi:hypothetical protein